MNTKKVVGVIAGILLVGGGVSMFMQSSDTGNGESLAASAVAVPSQVSGSVEDLLALGQDVVCTFEEQNAQGTVSGDVYVSGPRLRSNFAFLSEQGNFEGSMIRDGEYVYTWGGTPFGQFASKIAFRDFDEENIASQVPVDMPHDLDYTCAVWDVDASVFVLPTDIEFVEIDMSLLLDADLMSAGI